ncbi:microcin [Klebsiella sp. BIGb0407]|uniref:E492 group microcin n=1 Tax=Klebsiella sp. BIGb0407 TaxID=2940603 RepID=UPI002167B6C4|nr:microcin [Klebsiella sp. BIGb0407]MCS3431769.1 hypothetical protein [Klebsiella sp. BIGb0407]
MKEISKQDLALVFGAGDPNDKLVKDLGENMAWGAAFGVRGGPAGMALGATAGALQTVGQGLINHGPVNVPVPVLMGPNWNGSGSNTPNNVNNRK